MFMLKCKAYCVGHPPIQPTHYSNRRYLYNLTYIKYIALTQASPQFSIPRPLGFPSLASLIDVLASIISVSLEGLRQSH